MTELTDERLAAIREDARMFQVGRVFKDRRLLLTEVDRLRRDFPWETLNVQDNEIDELREQRDEARRVAVDLWVKDNYAGGHRATIERYRKELADD